MVLRGCGFPGVAGRRGWAAKPSPRCPGRPQLLPRVGGSVAWNPEPFPFPPRRPLRGAQAARLSDRAARPIPSSPQAHLRPQCWNGTLISGYLWIRCLSEHAPPDKLFPALFPAFVLPSVVDEPLSYWLPMNRPALTVGRASRRAQTGLGLRRSVALPRIDRPRRQSGGARFMGTKNSLPTERSPPALRRFGSSPTQSGPDASGPHSTTLARQPGAHQAQGANAQFENRGSLP
jgi:hypothetical protein